jgi:cell wall assembly regulator SMI1
VATRERLPALLSRLERWLAQHRPRFLAGLRAGASGAELEQLAAALPCRLPTSLRSLLGWHNGQSEEFTGRFENDWLLMGSEEIARAKRERDQAPGDAWRKSWLPFLDNDAGDFLCLDTARRPEPVCAYWLGIETQPLLAPSLTAWFADFVHAVEAGRYHEDPERGTFLRKRYSR